MSLTDEEKREVLFNFIQKTFDEGDLERADGEEQEEWSFSEDKDISVQYKVFLSQQKVFLNRLMGRELDRLLGIVFLIEDNGLCIMDKEDMVGWEASGFCFNKEGKLVIFHPR